MSNDLISREALKKTIEQYQIQWNKNCDIDIAYWNCCGKILAIIDNAPAVETHISPEVLNQFAKYVVEHERPQGEWIEQKAYPFCYECSICATEYTRKHNFCGNCGAKMKPD